MTHSGGATPVNGVDWFDAPLPGQGNVVHWELMYPGTADYSDPRDKGNYEKGHAVHFAAHEWLEINNLDVAGIEALETDGLDPATVRAKLWRNQPGFVCVYKDSKPHYDFTGQDYWLISETIDETNPTFGNLKRIQLRIRHKVALTTTAIL